MINFNELEKRAKTMKIEEIEKALEHQYSQLEMIDGIRKNGNSAFLEPNQEDNTRRKITILHLEKRRRGLENN